MINSLSLPIMPRGEIKESQVGPFPLWRTLGIKGSLIRQLILQRGWLNFMLKFKWHWDYWPQHLWSNASFVVFVKNGSWIWGNEKNGNWQCSERKAGNKLFSCCFQQTERKVSRLSSHRQSLNITLGMKLCRDADIFAVAFHSLFTAVIKV